MITVISNFILILPLIIISFSVSAGSPPAPVGVSADIKDDFPDQPKHIKKGDFLINGTQKNENYVKTSKINANLLFLDGAPIRFANVYVYPGQKDRMVGEICRELGFHTRKPSDSFLKRLVGASDIVRLGPNNDKHPLNHQFRYKTRVPIFSLYRNQNGEVRKGVNWYTKMQLQETTQNKTMYMINKVVCINERPNWNPHEGYDDRIEELTYEERKHMVEDWQEDHGPSKSSGGERTVPSPKPDAYQETYETPIAEPIMDEDTQPMNNNDDEEISIDDLPFYDEGSMYGDDKPAQEGSGFVLPGSFMNK